MKILYIECNMGVAGDMLAAALSELVDGPERYFPVIPNVEIKRDVVKKGGIQGTGIDVLINGEAEDGHAHGHSTVADINGRIEALTVSDHVKANVREVYADIAGAEGKVHGVPVSAVHFHEVGALDALADIACVSSLIEAIAPDEIVVSPVATGFGSVSAAHGVLPVPAPATAELLRGVPAYAGDVEGELTTPTGAALVRHFAGRFGQMPPMTVSKIGVGMGKKDFARPNCVRVFLGESESAGGADAVEICCNLDDMTGEAVGFAQERLWEAGALDVWTTPIYMKKNRPGFCLSALAAPERARGVAEAMLRHTTTFGVRMRDTRRMTLDRRFETRRTPFGDASVKIGEGFGIVKSKVEYEDAASIAEASVAGAPAAGDSTAGKAAPDV